MKLGRLCWMPLALLAAAAISPCVAGPTAPATPNQGQLPLVNAAPSVQVQVDGEISPALEQALNEISQGQYAQAIKQADTVVAAEGSMAKAAPAYEVRGVAQYLSGDTAAAIESLKHAVTLNPVQGSALTRLGSIAADQGRLPEAKDWFDQALHVDPKDQLAKRRLGLVLDKLGDTAGAIAVLQDAAGSSGPQQAMARLDLAELYNRQHRYSDTVALLSGSVDRRSTDRAALLDLGVADVNSGISTTGLDLLRRAHELDPSDQQATITLAIAQRTSGNASDAIATLKPLTQGTSASAVALYQLGLTDLAMSNYEDAKTAFEQAKARNPDSTMIEQGIGETLLLGGQPDQAIALFKSLADSDKGRMADYVALATANQMAGNLDAAEQAYEAAVARFPNDADAYWRLGAMRALQRRYPEALESLEKAEQLAPKDPRILRDISLVQLRQGDMKASIATAQRLVSLDPKSADARFFLAGLYQDSGDQGKAADLYKAILADHPDDVYALNNMAALLTDQGNASAALPLARHAASLAPSNAAVADTLGWALLRAGKASDAVSSLQHAATLAPDNPETLYRLAAAQKAAGDAGAARSNAAKALTISTTFKDSAAAKELAAE